VVLSRLTEDWCTGARGETASEGGFPGPG
jgi:hypothetical protein